MKIKMNVTKKQGVEKILNLLELKFGNKNQSIIGIDVDDDGNGKIDYGFSCYNDQPKIVLFPENYGEEGLGDCPNVCDWDDEIRNGLITYISDSWFNEIVDENGDPLSIEFQQ